MSHLEIPFFSEMDRHYSPQTSPAASRSHSVTSSRVQLPVMAALDSHFSPRPSVDGPRRGSVESTTGSAKKSPQHSQLNLPFFSNMDKFYSPRPSMDERRPSAITAVEPCPASASAPAKKAPKQDNFMRSMQSFPWFSGAH